MRYSQEISFVTGGNSATCGVSLELGEEYLIGLYRSGPNTFDPDQDGQLTVGLCDLVQDWGSVSDEDMATLEAGCDNDDPCSGSCTDTQVRDGDKKRLELTIRMQQYKAGPDSQ